MSETLKPCPFCGGEAETHEVGFPYHYWDVWCDGECFDHFCEKPTEAEAIAAWNTRAATTIGKVQVEVEPVLHGTLTAEQVQEAIERNFGKVAVLDDGKPVEWRDDWVCKVGINYKAIADELNADLGSETCRITASATDGLCTDNPRQWFKLSCGHSFTVDCLEVPVACPVCGKAVER